MNVSCFNVILLRRFILLPPIVSPLTENWYDVGGVHVTGAHTMRKDGVWVRVKNSGARPISQREVYYVVYNENHRTVTIRAPTTMALKTFDITGS